MDDSRAVRRTPFIYWALLRYPCTWVGALRLLLLVLAVVAYVGDGSGVSRWLFVLSIGTAQLLDVLDGYLARKLGHVSRFGALFDFLIDQTTHTVLWLASGALVAIPLMVLEWLTGIAVLRAALRAAGHWKEILLAQGGALIRVYFARQQRNALAALGVFSHFALPAALYLGWTGWPVWLWVPGVALYAWVTLLMWMALRKTEGG